MTTTPITTAPRIDAMPLTLLPADYTPRVANALRVNGVWPATIVGHTDDVAQGTVLLTLTMTVHPTFYPTLEGLPAGHRVRVYRDDTLLVMAASPNAAFEYLAALVPYSVSHALQHEGYRCEAVYCPACVAFAVRFRHNATAECDCPKCHGYCRCVLS